MKKVSLSGSPRENVGKKDAAQLRSEGQVPCVLYGGKEQIHFSVDKIELDKLIYTPNVYQVELEVDGNKYNTIIQEMQFHPVTDAPVHFDFLQLFDDKPVKVKLPVRITGTSPGVVEGGKMLQLYRKLKVKGLPGDLPEDLEVDISNLKIGDSFYVRDLEIDGITFLDSPSAVVVSVKTARAVTTPLDELEADLAAEEGGEEGGEEGVEAKAESAE